MKTVFSSSEIVFCLDKLNIPREDAPNHKNWLGVLCPNHNDTNYGSCSINLNTGVFSCFVCGFKKHIVSLVMERMSLGYKDSVAYIKNIDTASIQKPLITYDKVEDEHKNYDYEDFLLHDFNPESYYYTHSRGFTLEFCKQFKVKQCLSRQYRDYFMFPIVDTAQEIKTFEARRLKEREHLSELYNQPYSDKLKSDFEDYIDGENIKFRRGKLFKGTEQVFDDDIYYQLRPKVLYPVNSNVQNTIFNVDNLNYNEILYLVEGFGSVPKIWTHISKNVSCFFGVKLSEKQIEILKKFKNIIHIPDKDKAGYESVCLLNKELMNIGYRVIDTDFEDTDDDYVSSLLNRRNMRTAPKYIFQYLKEY